MVSYQSTLAFNSNPTEFSRIATEKSFWLLSLKAMTYWDSATPTEFSWDSVSCNPTEFNTHTLRISICHRCIIYLYTHIYIHITYLYTHIISIYSDQFDWMINMSSPYDITMCTFRLQFRTTDQQHGLEWSIKWQVSFAEYSLFYRALLQKRPII